MAHGSCQHETCTEADVSGLAIGRSRSSHMVKQGRNREGKTEKKKKKKKDAIKNKIWIKYDSAFWLHVTPFFSSTVTQQLQMYFGLTQLV